MSKRTQNSVHKTDNPHLNEPFPLVPCINLINHNLNEPLPTSLCKKLITHVYKAVRINKKTKISRKMRTAATIVLINQGKVLFCVWISIDIVKPCIYENLKTARVKIHWLSRSKSSGETCLICLTLSMMSEGLFAIKTAQ